MHSRQAGIVKWFDAEKGIGVIRAEQQPHDYLVLRSAIRHEGLQAGERVWFEPANERLAAWAMNVTRVDQ